MGGAPLPFKVCRAVAVTSAFWETVEEAPPHPHVTVREALMLSSHLPGLCKHTNCRKTDAGTGWTGRQGMFALARSFCLPAHPEMCAPTLAACPGAAVSLCSLSLITVNLAGLQLPW